ncbi:MAG: FtsX-like permease family protein [Euryarchaeota archaeon]|nr:FtsX-like permease family protein [Euryarchaeota archaeon]
MLNLLYVALFAIILGVILALAARRSVLFKMGARNFVRHRTHSALVVCGLLMGTAIISGAMVTGDSIDNFIVKSTYDTLHLVDVTVAAEKNAYFNESFFWSIRNDTAVQEHSDGIAPMIKTVVSVEDNNSGQYESSVSLMGFDPVLDRDFGAFTLLDGTTTYGDELPDASVLINANAADLLDASAGDTLKIRYRPQGSPYGVESTFTVSSVVRDEGKGAYATPGIFIRYDVAQSMLNVSGQLNQIRISGIGDVKTGVAESVAITEAVNATLNATFVASADPVALKLKPTAVKADQLEQSKNASEMITMFITIFGSFSIIAGIILIINIFTMLAEERKSELGMARAVGMTRKDLMQMFLFEGSTYTIAAAAIGTLVGLVIAYSLIYGVNNIFTMFGDIEIPFYFEWSSLVNAFCAGAAITFLTIIVASWRVTNINIVRAIRDIEEPVQRRTSSVSAALGGIFTCLVVLVLILNYDNLIIRYVAPCMALMGLALALRWAVSARVAFSVSGLGIVVWTLYAIATFFEGNDTNVQYLMITAGVFLTLAAVITVMFNSPVVVGFVSGTVGRIKAMRPIVKTAVSHPLNKRFRTGMTVAMFTLVIFTIVMVSAFTAIFSMNMEAQVEKQGGGYQVIGTTQMPLQDIGNASIFDVSTGNFTPVTSDTLSNSVLEYEQISIVSPTPSLTVDGVRPGGGGGGPFGGMGSGSIGLWAIDDHFIDNNHFEFSNISDGYADGQAVWSAVRNDSSKIVYGGGSFGGGAGFGVESSGSVKLGSVIEMRAPNGTARFTVIGILDEMVISGLITTKDHAQALFASPTTFIGNVIFLFDVKPGEDVQAVTYGIERDFRAFGMNTINLRETVATMFEMINSIFMLFEIFLGLGLVVGIAGLGIITIRSVVERRREIGIMRAIGFTRGDILSSFITEILFITTLSVAIGISVGLTVAYEIFTIMVSDANLSFVIPWTQLAWIMGITYVASLGCTIGPAFRASMIPPSEALRTNE